MTNKQEEQFKNSYCEQLKKAHECDIEVAVLREQALRIKYNGTNTLQDLITIRKKIEDVLAVKYDYLEKAQVIINTIRYMRATQPKNTYSRESFLMPFDDNIPPHEHVYEEKDNLIISKEDGSIIYAQVCTICGNLVRKSYRPEELVVPIKNK